MQYKIFYGVCTNVKCWRFLHY